MRIVFMGTPEFAVPCLERLLQDGHEVAGVFTQPDKPKGRGYAMAAPPVKQAAQRAALPVFQPISVKTEETLAQLRELAPELIVVVAYGKILPRAVLELPEYGCINVHASLLPRLRGAAPIQWAILRGDQKSGVTTMYMDTGLDTGDMLLKAETPIGADETAGELHDRLSQMGAQLLSDTLHALQRGSLRREPQREEDSTYAPMLDKSLCPIDWSKTAQEIHNQIRGLSPWPVAVTRLRGRQLKVHTSRLEEQSGVGPAGAVVVGKDCIRVVCGDGRLLSLVCVQPEGGKRMAAADFLRGHPIQEGTILGE
ncbi:MAG TPA: methionyl-tRNA formyltransferase [Candidatus Fimivicinus intestinavium]|nr:methionyl-tRNA formyltransferase [Candidatus Fimivicinus intestinavium]